MVESSSSPESIGRASAELGVVALLALFAGRRFGSRLVNHQGVVADLLLSACVRAVFAVFVHPVGRDHDLESFIDDAHLQIPVHIRCGAQGWGGIHLDEPWFQLLIDQNVVAVELEAVLVVNHH